jgi:hypothetical protein
MILDFLKSQQAQILNLQEVERLAGLTPRTIYKAVNGYQSLPEKHLVKLAEVLGPIGLKAYIAEKRLLPEAIKLHQNTPKEASNLEVLQMLEKSITALEQAAGVDSIDCLRASTQAYKQVWGEEMGASFAYMRDWTQDQINEHYKHHGEKEED